MIVWCLVGISCVALVVLCGVLLEIFKELKKGETKKHNNHHHHRQKEMEEMMIFNFGPPPYRRKDVPNVDRLWWVDQRYLKAQERRSENN